MNTTDITETEVIKAAESIAANGVIPTISAIRQFLGNRGSETTLHKYLYRWKLSMLGRTSELDKMLRAEKLKNELLKKMLEEIRADLVQLQSFV